MSSTNESAVGSVASSNANSSDKYVAILSKRLLEGWTMLAESCPNCYVPLIRSKQGAIFCVKCQMYCVKENEIPGNYTLGTAPTSLSNATTAQTQSLESAPVTAPNLGAPRSKEAATRHVSHDDDTDDWKPPTQEEMSQIEARRKKNDLHSAAIAKKLLEGWTLLNDCCPKPDCTVPLVRNRNGQLFCVSCNNWIPISSETGKPVAQVPTSLEVRGKTSTTPASTTATSAKPPPTPTAKPQGANPAVQAATKGHVDIALQTVASLYSKLDMLRLMLESTTDVSEIQGILACIKDCATSIQILEAL